MNRRTALLVAVVVALAAVLALVWPGDLASRLPWGGQDDPSAEAPIGVAEDAALAFFTLDHRRLDEDRARLLALTTDAFADTYQEESEALRQQVEEQRMVLTASVPQAGTAVESLSEDDATVLVAVDVRTRAKGGAEGDERYRTRLHLVVDEAAPEGWLVDRVEQVAVTEDGPDAELGEDAGDAVAAAAATLPLALSYDYRELEAGVASATAGMTSSFAAQFRDTFAGSAAELAQDKQAVTSATVLGAGLVRLDGDDRALCLVFVDQALVSSATLGAPERPVQVSENRVLVEVERVDDRWLVDSIEPF